MVGSDLALRYRWVATFLWATLTSVPVVAEPVLKGLTVESVLRSGPSAEKIDLVFCGDGYLQSERKGFRGDVDALLAELWAISPYKELKSEFNVHLVYLDAPTGPRIQGKRTGEFLLGSFKRPEESSDLVHLRYPQRVDAVTANAPACDLPIVVTRMEGRSHSGKHVVVSRKAKLVLAHELGHRLAALGDEYTSSSLLADRDNRPLPGKGDLPNVNLTLSAFIDPTTPQTIKRTAKWKHFLELPDGDVVSAYQGGYYRVVDVWRPTNRCVMSEGRYPDFCPVCHEHLYRSILERNAKSFHHDSYHRDYPLRLWRSPGVAPR
jgi:hypothetical protein